MVYTGFMVTKRTSHAVYDTKYHLVWMPKYHKWSLRNDIRHRAEELFTEIAKNHDIDIETMEIAVDHVHLSVSFPPRYSIARVVRLLKSILVSLLFQEFPDLKRYLWGGQFWEDGYFACTAGGKFTADVICKYIRYHQEDERIGQLELF